MNFPLKSKIKMYAHFIKLYKTRVTYSFIKESFKKYSNVSSEVLDTSEEINNELESVLKKYGTQLQYNSVVDRLGLPLGYKRSKDAANKINRNKLYIQHAIRHIEPLPLSLKYVTDMSPTKKNQVREEQEEPSFSFPYANKQTILVEDTKNIELSESQVRNMSSDEEIRYKFEKMKEMQDWMTAYDNYNDCNNTDNFDSDNWQINYGTPDPKLEVSNVPCGGCGALLHCKDTAIPGYIPSEIYKNHAKKGGASLEAIICQRCYFLKNYNMALQVNVSEDDYPKILTTISKQKALVVLLVDLLDFPCSIWPGIADILGPKTPVVIVGNKVDLLPKDDNNFINNIKETLFDYCKMCGFGTSNIKNVALISAKTGYGIENLITILQKTWKFQGDVYLVGCTNVGKSSLFNALLQSDYCKIQATELIQRATTSVWPGTTLNLLKFPIMRPSAYRIHLRQERLKVAKKMEMADNKHRSNQLKSENVAKYATLIGHIGVSYRQEVQESNDMFNVSVNSNVSGKVKMGLNEKHPDYALSRWCFDTPGVIQSDQIINLLTTDELMLTLPKQIIRPVTFCVKPGSTLFIAGLGRLDYIEGAVSVRLTVFRSSELPITISDTAVADELYDEFLGKELFAVPINISNRLTKWPGLHISKSFSVIGADNKVSTKDIVLSSAGWIAINIKQGEEGKFVAWTPEKRGCFLRDCLLPKAVQLRGRRRRFTPVYEKHKFI